jgi:flavodoxin I
MKFLLLFATYSGGTEEVKNIVRDILKGQNHEITEVNPKDVTPELISGSDLIICCTPTWDFEGREGQPHEDYFALIKNFSGKNLDRKKFAVIGLGDSSYPVFCGSVNVLESFIKDLNGILVQPSLKIDGYFYDTDKYRSQIIRWTNSLLG